MNDYVAELKKMTVWELRDMAGCLEPDSPDSPGAKFLNGIRDDLLELIQTDDMTPEVMRDSRCHEVADQAAYALESRSTWGTWRVFTDLGGWEEDLSEVGYDYQEDQGGLTKGALTALYIIAERLCQVVAGRWEQALSDAEDEVIMAATCNDHGVYQCVTCSPSAECVCAGRVHVTHAE